MKHFEVPQINTPQYWDTHQTAMDFGLRQRKYLDMAGSKGERIIEFGCGLSPFLDMARHIFPRAVGVDFSTETVLTAADTYPEVSYVCASVIDVPFPDAFFDVSVAGEVIEHLNKPEDLVHEMARVTRHRIIISTPILEFSDPEHLWEFSEVDLHNFLEPYGDVTTETVESSRFPGRKYIFALCNKRI